MDESSSSEANRDTPKSQQDSDRLKRAKMQRRVDAARTYTRDGKYERALELLEAAIEACACKPGVHKSGRSCHRRQCLAAVQSPDADQLYRVARERCSCGFRWPSCTEPLHIKALEAIVECKVKLENYLSAFTDALALVRLAPTLSVGYCRVAGLLRNLSRQHRTDANPTLSEHVTLILRDADITSADKLRDLTVKFVRCGLHNVAKNPHSSNDKLRVVLRQMSHHLKMPESRKDPVVKLPRELVGMIFSYLETSALFHCVRVSKQWNQVLSSDNRLWREIRLQRPFSCIPARGFSNFLQRHGNVKKIVIQDASDFFDRRCLLILRQIVRSLPDLECLCLGASRNFPCDPTAIDLKMELGVPGSHLTKLTHLSLQSINWNVPPYEPAFQHAVFHQIIELARASLQYLDIERCPLSMHVILQLNPMPKLRYLKMSNYHSVTSLGNLEWLPMRPVVKAAPNLETLILDGWTLSWDGTQPGVDLPDSVAEKAKAWKTLRHLVLGGKIACGGSFAERCLPPLNSKMRSIEILVKDPPKVARSILYGAETVDGDGVIHQFESTSSDHVHWPELETFCCRAALPPDLLESALGPAIKSGSLRAIELTLDPSPGWHGGGAFQLPTPARDYAFAASDAVRYLGLYDFNWAEGSSTFDGTPVLDWLDACFPNVDTVAMYPGGAYNGVAAFIMRLICRPQIKCVIQDILKGREWHEAQELAEKHGVKLHHIPQDAQSRNKIPLGVRMTNPRIHAAKLLDFSAAVVA